ncbi:MAG: NMD3-related protein, partial [Candidatus Micrarchaeota archaeon]
KLPTKVNIIICAGCGKIKNKGKWERRSDKLIEEIAVKAFRKSGFEGKFNVSEGVWKGIIEGAEYSCPVEIAIEKIMCKNCSRASSGYFEAIIQLRGEKGKIDKYLKKIVRRVGKNNSISKIEEMHGGVDVYVAFKKEIGEILSEGGMKFARTRKLVGERRDGRRIYRDTYLVRFG